MLLALLVAAATSFLSFVVHRAFYGPLGNIPGPLICRLTSFWTYYHSYIGDECTQINGLHKTYGSVVRIAPNEVVFSDGLALAPVYSDKGGFMKAPCYSNFDIEGHSTIFSTLDPAHRSVRSKAVLPMFSLGNIRANGQDKVEECVARFIARLKTEAHASRGAAGSEPVNVQNLTRALALDAVSSYLFGESYGGICEQTDRLSATAFVDALVAVGRFFFLPNWLFLSLELARTKLWPDQSEHESATKVDSFTEQIVREAERTDTTYQGRLLRAGISQHEVEVQCKDLIFAGTDSTGTNLATIIWHLAKRPDILDYNPQSVRMLDAVVKEGLRLSMANPTRFPRTVSPQGLHFKAENGPEYFIPGGTQIGLQVFTLHLNPDTFPDPYAFKPERWLENVSPKMQRDYIPFGLGSRQCIARNLATTELLLATRALAREGVLEGAKAVKERIELLEWFNSSVVGEKIEIVW
ncbi:hypothetical protein LTR78_002459 [Recurvomyces mirabilis]|uniref:Cytochrome P450 n=1 Tax=Recurvomyces mirabilis TaxID=574656 RepID=A0AAE1C4K8_9PEZI|nr:hypothetical protein LTR78_002459 [Recurvomyces mirabilis]KAK5157388.1 hypothetical protein LTS14_004153 [Recurvomyces mirabilis]